MGSKATSILLSKVQKDFKSIEVTRKRMDKLYSEGKIYKKDINHVYGAMFIKVLTTFEGFLEELFIGLLCERYKLPTRKKCQKVIFKDKKITYSIILSGNSYADWLPYDKLMKKAKIYYHDGKPFSILTAREKGILKKMMAIRNAIAHNSPYSNEKFQKIVLSSITSLPSEYQKPAGFLRYIIRSSPSQSNFEVYLLETIAIVNRLVTYA